MHRTLALVGLIAALAVVALFFRYMWNARSSLPFAQRWALLASDFGVVTLAQAALNTQDDVDLMAIDEFRKQSWFLNNLVFHDAVNPSGGGSTLTYGYTRLITQGTAGFRAINSEYTPQEVTKARYTVDLKPLGGSFQIDRVLDAVAAGAETALQMRQKIKATVAAFNDAVINGDTDVDSNGFDGLNKILRGTSTEVGADTVTDWSAISPTDGSWATALSALDDFLAHLDGAPTALIGNRAIISKVRAIARAAQQYTADPVTFDTQGLGPVVERYGNVVFVDAGTKAGSSDLVIPTETRDVDNSIYTIAVTGSPTGGTFTLTVTVDGDAETTTALAYNADAPTVQAALIALSNVPANAVTVTGTTTKTITFLGAMTDDDVTLAMGTNSLTGGSSPSVTVTESANTANATNVTDLYAVRLGMDGFHGVSAAGGQLVKTWLPDFTIAGAVKTGEVEMGPVAVALKATLAAAVLRNIKLS